MAVFRPAVHEIFPGTVVARDGGLVPNEAPGHGVDFDEVAARRHPVPEPGEHDRWAVRNNSAAYVKLTDTKVSGPVSGTVHRMSGTVPRYDHKPLPQPTRAALYVADPAPHETGIMPKRDATAAIQRTLDRARLEGGGTVYLPAGWYRVDGHLGVPDGVELRGASSVPNRDLVGASGGTVLMAHEGRGTAHPDTATALITLNGKEAGVRGLRVLYPENNPAAADDPVPYPFAIRGNGPGTYAVAWSSTPVR